MRISEEALRKAEAEFVEIQESYPGMSSELANTTANILYRYHALIPGEMQHI